MNWSTIAVRYNRQYNQFSCGPVAILNALRWGGRRVTYGYHYAQLAKDCRLKDSDDNYGTWSADLDKTLRRYGKKYLTILKPRKCTYKRFEQHLRNGGAAIICYPHSNGEIAHFTFIAEFNPETQMYLSINDQVNETHTERTKKEIKSRFTKRIADYPHVWLLNRLEK